MYNIADIPKYPKIPKMLQRLLKVDIDTRLTTGNKIWADLLKMRHAIVKRTGGMVQSGHLKINQDYIQLVTLRASLYGFTDPLCCSI